MIARIGRVAGGAVEVLVGVLLLAIVAIVFAEVVIRYVTGGSLAWGEEAALLLWVWMIQLGAVRASHMRIEFFLRGLPARPRMVFGIALALFSIALLCLLTWGATRMIALTRHDYFVAMPWLSVSLSYWAVVVAAPLWIVAIVARAIDPSADRHLSEGYQP